MKSLRIFLILLGIAGFFAPSLPRDRAHAAGTEKLYLSGTDKDHTVDWQFLCTSGRKSGSWTTIPVPSNWEMQGFGTYTYGFNLAPNERGQYKREFTPPARWNGRHTFLVFEGSMTDTDARINGVSVGPIHQGAFYRFKYDVTSLLHYGEPNLLEVAVSKDSADQSINRAERLSDFWVFGGIYRPVYLESTPAQYIDRVAVNAQASGDFALDVYCGGAGSADTLAAQITKLDGSPVGKAFEERLAPAAGDAAPAADGTVKRTLHTTAAKPLLWTAETPNLYHVKVRLLQNGREVHSVTQRFGFRTIEVRAGDGIYLNGQKIVLKGSCRHSFWPETGRTTSPTVNRNDILLMKQMNMNAVRMSHYPPDQDFLDSADAIGIYVLDELGGWQKKYDTPIGTRLVRETVVRDVNHPSILFWDNGNEGGWNTDIDPLFALYDPQARKVLHPWALFSGINTAHYRTYQATANFLNGKDIVMPTEFLHGLFDGGAGTGLNDYWKLMQSKPLSAGGFIWAFLDEGIVRLDRNGAIDVAGNAAPDGILGPYREKEGSFYTIKEIWSPIEVVDAENLSHALPADFNGQVALINHYGFTNASQCRFGWQLRNFSAPSSRQAGYKVVSQGRASAPDIAPDARGTLALTLPAKWQASDALALTATDSNGHELYTWVWPIKKSGDYQKRIVLPAGNAATFAEDADSITLTASGTAVTLSKSTGRLLAVQHAGKPFSLRNGPSLASGTATFASIAHAQEGDSQVVQANYTGDLSFVRWRMHGNGWLQLDYQYSVTGPQNFMGVNFDYPEKQVRGVKWLGKGPFHVYKNRLRGVTTSVWEKAYNDTATGRGDGYDYPEFKGYHANVSWAQLQTTEGLITLVAQEDNLFLRLYTPRNGRDPVRAFALYPAGDISLLDGIAPMGAKINAANELGPEGQPNQPAGPITRTVYWYFGDLQK